MYMEMCVVCMHAFYERKTGIYLILKEVWNPQKVKSHLEYVPESLLAKDSLLSDILKLLNKNARL